MSNQNDIFGVIFAVVLRQSFFDSGCFIAIVSSNDVKCCLIFPSHDFFSRGFLSNCSQPRSYFLRIVGRKPIRLEFIAKLCRFVAFFSVSLFSILAGVESQFFWKSADSSSFAQFVKQIQKFDYLSRDEGGNASSQPRNTRSLFCLFVSSKTKDENQLSKTGRFNRIQDVFFIQKRQQFLIVKIVAPPPQEPCAFGIQCAFNFFNNSIEFFEI